MSSLSIRYKIWVSFGLLLALLMAVGFVTVQNLHQNETKLVELVNDVQPTVVLSLNLIDQLDRASASLGFYLLSKEEVHKKDYLVYLAKIRESAAALQSMGPIKQDPQATQIAKTVAAKIDKLESYKDHMLELAVNDALNVPAMQYASQEVNPRVQQMLQLLQQMLLSEEQEEANEQRKALLISVSNLRHTLVSAVNELRLYLAFRATEQIQNFLTFREVLEASVERLNAYDEDFLTFEQLDAVEQFTEIFVAYFKAADKLMEIHKAEDWRQDAFIIRKEIAPLLLEIQDSLNATVEQQHETSINDSQALTEQVNKTLIIVATLLGLGLFSATLIGLLLSRAINNPIMGLKESATQLAQGNLDQYIDTSRQDELGALAQSFSDMRDSIKKKIEDLRVLNSTGEQLAGTRSQLDALQTSLRVMGEQTNVEWGSVYLYNQQSKLLEIKAYFPERDGGDEHQAKSFKLGEGAAGKAAFKQQVIYIPDSSQDANFVVQGDGQVNGHAIICVPLIDNGEIFGVMNFSGEVGKVKFEKSDAEFAETIARMTVVTSKNIHMLNVIEEHNRTLEQKIQERTAELRQKTNDINNMLQNMHQGIFTIVEGNIVHNEYSAYLESILETNKIAGQGVMDILFAKAELSANEVDQIHAALGALVGEDALMFDCNRHCLIEEFNLRLAEDRIKILELDWDPIINEEDMIEKLMVTVRDVTALRGLQAEAEKQKWELEVIGQILAVSKKKFQGFIKSAYQFIAENESQVNATTEIDAEVIATLFRNMHTIKGNARTYGLSYITDVVHEAENTYDQLRKKQLVEWDQARLLGELEQSKQLIQTYEKIFNDIYAASDVDGVFVDSGLMELAKQTLQNASLDNEMELAQTVRRMQMIFGAIGTETVGSMLEGIFKSIPELATQLSKAAPDIIVKDNNVRLNPDVIPVLKDVFTHGFRNAVDHGLEAPDERRQAGKPDKGTITLEVDQVDDKLVFRLYDDGRGLPLERIKQKAIENGIFSAGQEITDEQIAEVIFHSGLSTANDVSDISGRGVGMDAVRRFVQSLGGDIQVRFTGEASMDHSFRPFESQITLPADVSVKVA